MICRMFSVAFSLVNLAAWTPMTTSSSGNRASSFFKSGRMWMQLMQPYVQKSSRTTLPRSAFSDRGAPTLSHATAPLTSGARNRSGHTAVRFRERLQRVGTGRQRLVAFHRLDGDRETPRPVVPGDSRRHVDPIAPAAGVLQWQEQQVRSGLVRNAQHALLDVRGE